MTDRDMRGQAPKGAQHQAAHEHHTALVHVLVQRVGVPYEVEQTVCADCQRVLDETPVKRPAA